MIDFVALTVLWPGSRRMDWISELGNYLQRSCGWSHRIMGFLQGEGKDKEMKTPSRILWKEYYSKDLEPRGLGRTLALPFIKCVTFDKQHNLFVPLFSHLYNGDNNSICFMGLLRGLNGLIRCRVSVQKYWLFLITALVQEKEKGWGRKNSKRGKEWVRAVLDQRSCQEGEDIN